MRLNHLQSLDNMSTSFVMRLLQGNMLCVRNYIPPHPQSHPGICMEPSGVECSPVLKLIDVEQTVHGMLSICRET